MLLFSKLRGHPSSRDGKCFGCARRCPGRVLSARRFRRRWKLSSVIVIDIVIATAIVIVMLIVVELATHNVFITIRVYAIRLTRASQGQGKPCAPAQPM